MKIPPSKFFTPVSLENEFNIKRSEVEGFVREWDLLGYAFGEQSLRGIPFQLGESRDNNAILLDDAAVAIHLNGVRASFLVFLHIVENNPDEKLDGFSNVPVAGNELGAHVSTYKIQYRDGTEVTQDIRRRFAIQQPYIGWAASPFEAITSAPDSLSRSSSEDRMLGAKQTSTYGRMECRHFSGRDSTSVNLWMYALQNPHPAKEIESLELVPSSERSMIFGISHTLVEDHPLRGSGRQKIRLSVPKGVSLNRIGELADVEIDLGKVISARVRLKYDDSSWDGEKLDIQPVEVAEEVVVEYTAHPQAKLYVGTGVDGEQLTYKLDVDNQKFVRILPSSRPVKISVVEKGTGVPATVRFHAHGESGEYLPPKGSHRKVNPGWFEDNYGEFVNGLNQYCYIPGECVIDLPLGDVYLDISKGYEMRPLRKKVTIDADTDELKLEIERTLDWRERGWVSADTHVHFLSPQTAKLEGEGEGVNVVNLLAAQWGEMFSNVSDFDGKSTFGSKEMGGDGEFLVRVGSENRMQVLGHISLLGYSGSMIHP